MGRTRNMSALRGHGRDEPWGRVGGSWPGLSSILSHRSSGQLTVGTHQISSITGGPLADPIVDASQIPTVKNLEVWFFNEIFPYTECVFVMLTWDMNEYFRSILKRKKATVNHTELSSGLGLPGGGERGWAWGCMNTGAWPRVAASPQRLLSTWACTAQSVGGQVQKPTWAQQVAAQFSREHAAHGQHSRGLQLSLWTAVKSELKLPRLLVGWLSSTLNSTRFK